MVIVTVNNSGSARARSARIGITNSSRPKMQACERDSSGQLRSGLLPLTKIMLLPITCFCQSCQQISFRSESLFRPLPYLVDSYGADDDRADDDLLDVIWPAHLLTAISQEGHYQCPDDRP